MEAFLNLTYRDWHRVVNGDNTAMHQHHQRRHFVLGVTEEIFNRDGFTVSSLMHCHEAADRLHHVVQKQAKRKLKDRGLRCSTDQPFQSEDFSDLLEHSFNSPAFQVHREQIHRGVCDFVQEVRHQDDLFLARSLQTKATNVDPTLGVLATEPAPFLEDGSIRRVLRLSRGMRFVQMKAVFRMKSNEEVISVGGQYKRLRQIAKLPIQHPQS